MSRCLKSYNKSASTRPAKRQQNVSITFAYGATSSSQRQQNVAPWMNSASAMLAKDDTRTTSRTWWDSSCNDVIGVLLKLPVVVIVVVVLATRQQIMSLRNDIITLWSGFRFRRRDLARFQSQVRQCAPSGAYHRLRGHTQPPTRTS